jgi:hypothetical protein
MDTIIPCGVYLSGYISQQATWRDRSLNRQAHSVHNIYLDGNKEHPGKREKGDSYLLFPIDEV